MIRTVRASGVSTVMPVSSGAYAERFLSAISAGSRRRPCSSARRRGPRRRSGRRDEPGAPDADEPFRGNSADAVMPTASAVGVPRRRGPSSAWRAGPRRSRDGPGAPCSDSPTIRTDGRRPRPPASPGRHAPSGIHRRGSTASPWMPRPSRAAAGNRCASAASCDGVDAGEVSFGVRGERFPHRCRRPPENAVARVSRRRSVASCRDGE